MALHSLGKVIMSLTYSIKSSPFQYGLKRRTLFAVVPSKSTVVFGMSSKRTQSLGSSKLLTSDKTNRVIAFSTSSNKSSSSNANPIISWYLDVLDKHPIVTKSVTCAVLNCMGDIISQVCIEHATTLDFARIRTFGFLGLVLVGPALHYWYSFLNRAIPASPRSAIIQLLLDQLVFAPFFLATILSTLFALEGKANQIPEKLRQDLFNTVRANWLLWVPAQFVNFRYVPPHLRVLASNVVALLWNTYISYTSHK
uniref:Uncharacterized protein n=1 Tax=Polytomella parva TaxID=51329 RepID=A0A7S0VKF2_9CHLO|mmetsp:Transcript_33934/g.61253  ORF Transcript_33934/g.61253 Transcript_33934/m.61253 type:complete len:254 (+) Transcript_33934:23-784(+)